MMRVTQVVGLASCFLMASPCAYGGHGVTMIPNNLVPNPFTGILYSLVRVLAI